MFERNNGFSAEGGFANLFRQLFGDMRQTHIFCNAGVGRVSGEDNFRNAKAFGGTKDSSNVMSRANIMGDDDNFWH